MLYYPRSPGLRAELALSTFRFAWRGEGSETRVTPHTQNQEHIHTRTRKWHPSCRERTSGSSAHSNAWPVPEFPGTLPTSCTRAGCSLSLEYSYLDPGMTHRVYQVVTNMPYLWRCLTTSYSTAVQTLRTQGCSDKELISGTQKRVAGQQTQTSGSGPRCTGGKVPRACKWYFSHMRLVSTVAFSSGSHLMCLYVASSPTLCSQSHLWHEILDSPESGYCELAYV